MIEPLKADLPPRGDTALATDFKPPLLHSTVAIDIIVELTANIVDRHNANHNPIMAVSDGDADAIDVLTLTSFVAQPVS